MADRTAAGLRAQLVAALDLHEDAKRRYAELRAWGRAAHPELPPATADMRTQTYRQMQDAMTDYVDSRAEAQMYAAALTAMCAYAEQINHRRARRSAVADDDLRDCKPAVGETVHAGFAINTGDKRRWPE
jgi:hypothetical protein